MANIIEITDFSSPQLDVYARLSENQLLHYNEPHGDGLFIAESPNVIMRAISAGYVPLSFLVEDKHIETQAKEILSLCPDVPVYTAAFDVLAQLTGFKLTRGMLSAMQRKPLPSLEEICRDKRRIAVLENVMNPPTSAQFSAVPPHLAWMRLCLPKAAATRCTAVPAA